MQTIIILATNQERQVSNSEAHTLIEQGKAILKSRYKAIEQSPKDKMVKKTTAKLRNKYYVPRHPSER